MAWVAIMAGTEPADPRPDSEGVRSSPLARVRRWLWGLVALALVGAAWLYFGQPRPVSRGENDFATAFGGTFEMVDQKGGIVTDQTLRGKPYAIFFGFTRCPDVCPTSLTRMAQIRQRLGDQGMDFNIVFVSVDPGHDTAEGIGSYLELFGTPIIGLTGSDAQIDRIVKAFHVFHRKVPIEGGDYTVDHTATVFLMDREGRFVSTIDYHEEPDVALQKMRRLLGAG